RRAHRALQALGWDEACAAAVGRADDADAQSVLAGLAALEASDRVVGLLDRLVGVLRGPALDRARWLRDRKALALHLDRLREDFRQRRIEIELIKVLGPGLYTGAYLGRMKTTGVEVVLRILRPEFALRPQVRAHFLELSKRSARYVHQNLVLTRDAGEHDDCGLYYTVRDYVIGATLREVLESGRRFDPPQAAKILRQVIDGLTPVHADGRVHGGVKPSNLFLTADDRVILGDPSLPLPGIGEDTARLAYDYRYAPPELFAGSGLCPRSDFYSLGAVAHELYFGAPPFVSDNPFDLIARLCRDEVKVPASPHPHLTGWLRSLLARGRDDRFPTLDAVRAALDEALRPPAKQEQAARAMRPMTAADVASVHLLPPESLAAAAGVQSILPLTNAGGPVSEAEHSLDTPAPSGPGSSLPGYEILGELGRGGMGVVYKARQVALNRVVAIKMMRGGYAGDETRARFRREAEAVARLQHPNILQIFELGEHGGDPFIAMEFCDGGSLAGRLRREGPMRPEEAGRLVSELAGGMRHAHELGVLHRDLKPANVLLTAGGQPKITDFGLARLVGEEAHTLEGTVLGTPAYMPPEQAQGRAVGPAADVYALGAILYECLTGGPPFRAKTAVDTLMKVVGEVPAAPSAVLPGVPRELDAVCLKCLRKRPEERYASAAALRDDLDRFVAGEPVVARRARKGGWWPW
ncbi:MAG: protein kinase domain-containing protein, partial [Gemmataceae bacterium]